MNKSNQPEQPAFKKKKKMDKMNEPSKKYVHILVIIIVNAKYYSISRIYCRNIAADIIEF